MLGSSHLSSFAGTALVILLELDALDAYDMLLPCKGVDVPHASIQKLLLEDILQVVVLQRNQQLQVSFPKP